MYQNKSADRDNYPELKNVSHIQSSLFAVSSPGALLYKTDIFDSPHNDKSQISIQHGTLWYEGEIVGVIQFFNSDNHNCLGQF